MGSSGADQILAMASGQTLTGGAGADTLTGYSGFGDTFSDTVAGLNNDMIQLFGGSDVIDLTDLAFGSARALAYTGTSSSGWLTASDGAHAASIGFTGKYTTASFHLAGDGHGGSLISFAG